MISPYSVVHGISHEATEHGSIIKFIDELFNLTPLADLPDEAAARALGEKTYGQKYLGPSDDNTPDVGDLFSAFDNARLAGVAPPLPAPYAMIPAALVTSLPHFGGQGCRILQITPTDVVNGVVIDPAPADFNPRPSTNPGLRPGRLAFELGLYLWLLCSSTFSRRPDFLPVAGFSQQTIKLRDHMSRISMLLLFQFHGSVDTEHRNGSRRGHTRQIKAAGSLTCGVNTEEPEYSLQDAHGSRAALDVDICKALGVAVLGSNAKFSIARYQR